MNELLVAVLAGGESRRYGVSKTEARLENRTLLDIALTTAAEISDDVMIITGRAGKKTIRNIKTLQDLIPGCGPLGGLFTALHYTRRPFLATLPCDMPLLTADIYPILLKAASLQRPAVAVSHMGMEPLLAVWPVRISLPCLRISMKLGKFSLYQALRKLKAVKVNIPEVLDNYNPEIFCNINYPEDLHRLQTRQEKIHVC